MDRLGARPGQVAMVEPRPQNALPPDGAPGNEALSEDECGPLDVAMEPTPETEAHKELRKRIAAIQSDGDLSEDVKSKKIQELMCSEWSAIQRKRQPPRPLPSEATQRAQSFHSPGVLGCKHYQRGCKLVAACCGRIYPCRLCHDEHESHGIDRFATERMLCMHCGTEQPVAQYCANPACGRCMARYYCAVCKFWDDDATKDIYHCPYCRLCRIGKGLGIDFFHCQKCNACMTIARQEAHRCVERALDAACPVCLGGSLFTSTDPVVFCCCGHSMHETCFRAHVAYSSRCPRCQRSLYDASAQRARIAAELARYPVPPEFARRTRRIYCYDCERYSQAAWHWSYHACAHCLGYNTTF